jgi:hypothetical protein
VQRAQQRRRFAHDAKQRRDLIVVPIHSLPGEALPRDDASGPKVAAAIEGVAEDLLGRHVTDLALDDTCLRATRASEGPGNSEVGELRRSIDTHEDVRRRVVAMDDLEEAAFNVRRFVCGMEPRQRVAQDATCDGQRYPRILGCLAANQPRERISLDVLHHEIDAPFVFAGVHDRDHVGMPDAGGDLCFLLEKLGRIAGLGAHVRMHQLERDLAVDVTDDFRAGEVDHGHAAGPDGQEHLVTPDAFRGALVRHHHATVAQKA